MSISDSIDEHRKPDRTPSMSHAPALMRIEHRATRLDIIGGEHKPS